MPGPHHFFTPSEPVVRPTDPAVRRVAVEAIGAHGLLPYVDALLERATFEHDPSVISALAAVIARNEWEPTHDAGLVALRRCRSGKQDHPQENDDAKLDPCHRTLTRRARAAARD